MPEDEVEIEPDEEYEVVPLSPIRKLERRIEKLEERKSTGDTQNLINEVMDLVKSNQQMVNEVVKSNDELRRELQRIPEKVDEVLDQWEEFLRMLRRGEERGVPGADYGLSEKIDKLIEQNEEMVDSMRSLSRSMRSAQPSGSKRSGSPKLRIKKRKER